MADIDVNDKLRATAVMRTVDLSEVQNVYTLDVTDLGGGTTLQVLDRIVVGLETMYSVVAGLQNTRTKYIEVRFFNITQNIPLATRPWATLTQGVQAFDDLAHMTAAMFSLGVAIPGVAGRKFFGGIAEPALDQEGLWTVATLANLVTISAIMLTEITSTGTKFTFGIFTGIIPAYVRFVSSVTTNIPGSQRRRRQGVGI